MRLPERHFLNDGRSVGPVALVVLFGLALLYAVGACGLLVWAAVSPGLPRAWRLNLPRKGELDTTVAPDCPACGGRLTLGPVDERGWVARTDRGREVTLPLQTAECPACRRRFARHSLGKVWTGWAGAATPRP